MLYAPEVVLVGLCEHTHFHDKSLSALHSQTRTGPVLSIPAEVSRLYLGTRTGRVRMPVDQ